jgi:hypothetical protein
MHLKFTSHLTGEREKRKTKKEKYKTKKEVRSWFPNQKTRVVIVFLHLIADHGIIEL